MPVSSSQHNRGDRLLDEIVDRLVRTYHPERIYLFGSAARGDAGPHSDYDILIVMPDGSQPDLLRPARGYEALWGIDTAVDVHVLPRSRFDSRLHLRASLPSTVAREGRELYAA